MRTDYKRHAVLFTGLAMLLCALIPSCGQGELPSGEQESLPLHSQIVGHIANVQDLASELEDFTWHGLDDIGVQGPPAGCCGVGICIVEKGKDIAHHGSTWTTLTEMLPTTERATLLLMYCDKCLDMAEQMQSESPAASGWQDACRQLESTLRGAKHLASDYRNTAKYQLDEIEEAVANSTPSAQEQYLEEFQSMSARYLGLLDEIIDNLQQAEEARSQLADCQLSPLGLDKEQGADTVQL